MELDAEKVLWLVIAIELFHAFAFFTDITIDPLVYYFVVLVLGGGYFLSIIYNKWLL